MTDPDGLPPFPPEPPGSDSREAVTARLAVLRDALLDSASLDNIIAPAPVIDGLLYGDGIAWLYGKPGTYKSILALDWACCVSTGLPWLDHGTAEGPVLYLYAEGVAGLRARVRAWEARAGCTSKVMFLPVAVQVTQPVELGAFTALVGELKPSLIILDTQARVTVGIEENSAMEMGRVVLAASEIIRASRACLLVLHHEGRSGDNPRGSIAIEGSAVSLFRTEYDGERVRLVNRRQRDAVEEDPIILWPVPRDGSVVLSGLYSDFGVGVEAPLTPAAEEVLRLICDDFSESGASSSVVIAATNLASSTVYKALNTLVKKGLILSTGTKARSHYERPKSQLLRSESEYSDLRAVEYSDSPAPITKW